MSYFEKFPKLFSHVYKPKISSSESTKSADDGPLYPVLVCPGRLDVSGGAARVVALNLVADQLEAKLRVASGHALVAQTRLFLL